MSPPSESVVYPISEQDKDELLSSTTHDKSWRRHRQAFEALYVVWNPVTNEYERGQTNSESN